MKIRFYRVKLMTMKEGTEILPEGELWAEEGKITYSGPSEAAPDAGGVRWDRQIDGRGNLLMPGFKNAHTHSAMTFLRSYADDLPLLDWLNKQVFPMEARLSGDDVYHLSKLAVLEYLTSGITANFDMYMKPEQIAQASADMGFRTVIAGGLNDFTFTLEEIEDCYVKLNRFHPLISYCLGFHAEYTTSRELLEGMAALSRRYQAPVYSHNSESLSEVRQCLQRTGMTPTAYLDSLGMFQYGGGGYHCVHMSDEDLGIFKKRGLYAVTNPGSNTKLASGIAPIQRMLDMGIGLAIGTDGPASNNCLDMFREMFLTTGLAKLREGNAAAADAGRVLEMAVKGGAHAMGLWDCDTLEAGKRADLIMINLHRPNMQPENNLGKNLVYSGSKENVKLTMVDGKVLYEDGEFFVGEDAERIYRKANEIIGRCRDR